MKYRMKKTNFHIEDNCYILIKNSALDLHNDFSFVGMHYYPIENQIKLYWVKQKGDWIASDLPNMLELVFDDISFYKTSFNCINNRLEDASVLAFIGYLHPNDIEVMDGCLDEKESDESYYMILGFENGFSVKIFSKRVECLMDFNSNLHSLQRE